MPDERRLPIASDFAHMARQQGLACAAASAGIISKKTRQTIGRMRGV